MIKFRMLALTLALVTVLTFGGAAYAQEEELPDPGLTPDSHFYFLDNWGKKIGLLFAFSAEDKAEKALRYAEERLAEANEMAEKNRVKEMTRATGDYEQFMAMVNQRLQEMNRPDVSANVSERVAAAAAKHLRVLDRVRDRSPDEANEALIRARERALQEQQNALRVLARERLEKAVSLNLDTIEDRLERARLKASENVTEEVDEALEDAEEMYQFGENISEIARGLGKDTTQVEELIAKALSNHLQVLAEVSQKVPEPARESIENALATSLSNRARVIEQLREKAALGDIEEDEPALDNVDARVLARVTQRIQERLQEESQGVEPEEEQLLQRIRERLTEQLQEQVREGNPEAEAALAALEGKLARIRAAAEEQGITISDELYARIRALIAEAKSAFASGDEEAVPGIIAEAEDILNKILEEIGESGEAGATLSDQLRIQAQRR